MLTRERVGQRAERGGGLDLGNRLTTSWDPHHLDPASAFASIPVRRQGLDDAVPEKAPLFQEDHVGGLLEGDDLLS